MHLFRIDFESGYVLGTLHQMRNFPFANSSLTFALRDFVYSYPQLADNYVVHTLKDHKYMVFEVTYYSHSAIDVYDNSNRFDKYNVGTQAIHDTIDSYH